MQKLFTSRSTRSVVLFLLIGFGISYLSAKDFNTISGHWEGQIELPGQTLGINIDFFVNEENILSGDISIPLQGAKDLPLSEISLTGKKSVLNCRVCRGMRRLQAKFLKTAGKSAVRFISQGRTSLSKLARRVQSRKSKRDITGI